MNMDSKQLRERIVGAVVLVALGVIFIPMVLQQDDSPDGFSTSNIPALPEALNELKQQRPPDTVPLAAPPVPTRDLVDAQTPAATPVPAPPPAEVRIGPAAEEKPVAQTTPKPERAWVVQVASFGERNKAEKLRDSLRKAKYTAFVESIKTKTGILYRVRVGPVDQKSKAEELQNRLVSQQKLKEALVMPHP